MIKIKITPIITRSKYSVNKQLPIPEVFVERTIQVQRITYRNEVSIFCNNLSRNNLFTSKLVC